MRSTVTGDRDRLVFHAKVFPPLKRVGSRWRRLVHRIRSWWTPSPRRERVILLLRQLEGPGDNADDPRRDFMDVVARLALAIQKAGGDHLGDVGSVHRDLMRLMALVPRKLRKLHIHDIDERDEQLS